MQQHKAVRYHCIFHVSQMRNWNTDAIKTKSIHWLLVSFFCCVIGVFLLLISYVFSSSTLWTQNLRSFLETERDVVLMEKSSHPWPLQVGVFSRGRDRFLRTEELPVLALQSSSSFLHYPALFILDLFYHANNEIESCGVLFLWIRSLMSVEKTYVIL